MLYVDVTRLLTWDGNYTGMERFAYEISRALLEGKSGVRLCFFAPGHGFLELSDGYSLDGGRLTSPLLSAGPSLRALLREDKKAFAIRYAKRRAEHRRHRQLKPVPASPGTTMLIYDGLWDRGNYIDALLGLADKGVRLAHVVHDLVPLVMPHVCFDYVTQAFGNYFDAVAPHINVLFSISQNTQKDFLHCYENGLRPDLEKFVIRHGEDFSRSESARPSGLSVGDGGFILSVSTIEARKNYQLLYQAYRLAEEKKISLPKLVIVGREGWLAEPVIHAFKNDPLIKDKVVLAGPVSDDELSWLYDNCLFTAFPSLYEGWGLPVAESLARGKVCAASSSSSIPEIGGAFNKYFSPYDAAECLAVIKELTNDSKRKILEDSIRKKYKPTRWADTAGAIAEAISG